MTDPTEQLLRDSLQEHARDLPTVIDPWARVSRAHHRSRARRTAGAVAALTVVTVATGSLAFGQPWTGLDRKAAPAENQKVVDDQSWRKLEQGPARGPLGSDPGLRKDVLTLLQLNENRYHVRGSAVRKMTAKVIWADVRGERRRALVVYQRSGNPVPVQDGLQTPSPTPGTTSRVLSWMTGPIAGGAMRIEKEYSSGSAIATMNYREGGGGQRMLAVVQRGSEVSAARPVIGTDGRIRRTWQPVRIDKDGVADVPITDPTTRGVLLTLRSKVGNGKYLYRSLRDPETAYDWEQGSGFSPAGPADVAAALPGSRGPGAAGKFTSTAVLDRVLNDLGAGLTRTSPRFEWTGKISAAQGGGAVVAASAGLPGQGRLLRIEQIVAYRSQWARTITLASGTGPRVPGWTTAWRAPTPVGDRPTGQMVGWLVGPDFTSVKVKVDGKARSSTTQDGLGWITVKPGQKVLVTAERTGGKDITMHLAPKDVQPATGPGSALENPLAFTH